MNDLQRHEAFVRENFRDRTAVLALIDHYEESEHVGRWVAVRMAVRLRKQAREISEVGASCYLIDESSPVRDALFQMVLVAAPAHYRGGFVWNIIPGRSAPLFYFHTNEDETPTEVYWVCEVGARWLIRSAAEMTVEPTESEIHEALRFGKEF